MLDNSSSLRHNFMLCSPLGEGDPRFKQNLEEILWNPLNSPSFPEMDTFISAVKAVGLYGRACDPASTQQNPLLINAAAAASRDITLQFAHDILFRAAFDVQKALSHLLPSTSLYRVQAIQYLHIPNISTSL